MPHVKTYHVSGHVQKTVNQNHTSSPYELKLEAVNINDAMERFKAKAAQAGWHRAKITTVEAVERELAS